MSSSNNDFGAAVVRLWRDLQRKYGRDKDTIHSTWESLSPEQRKGVIVAGAARGEVLEHKNDRRLGIVCNIVPELNLRDLVAGRTLLDLLEQRATTEILVSYASDAPFMIQSMRANGFSYNRARKRTCMMFLEEAEYGTTYDVNRNAPRSVLSDMLERGNGYIVMENEGHMILQRQQMIYMALSLIVDDIMEMRRILDDPDADKRRPTRKTVNAKVSSGSAEILKALELSRPSTKTPAHSIDSLLALAQEQYLATDDHVSLLQDEHLYIAHVANHYFYSMDECIRDGNGELPGNIFSGRQATKAIFELLQDAYQARACWEYITLLTDELAKAGKDTSAPKLRKNNPLVTELWGTCAAELVRTRGIFRRMVQMNPDKYSKYFVREEGSVHFRDPVGVVSKKNKFTGWILEIASKDELATNKVAGLLQCLEEFQENAPRSRENITAEMGEALADVSVIMAFMTQFEKLADVPASSTSKFAKKMKLRLAEVEDSLQDLDLTDFAFPTEKLRDDSVAKECLRIVDRTMSEKLGINFDQAFDAPVRSAMQEVLDAYDTLKAKTTALDTNKPPFDPFINTPTSHEKLDEPVQGRALPKTKTRGVPDIHKILDLDNREPSSAGPAVEPEKVSASKTAVQTFKKLFRSDAPSRGAVSWAAFTSAMKSAGFKVEKVGGSVERFSPPKERPSWKPINLHRPHPGDKIEGWTLLMLRGRLRRRFGWDSVDLFVSSGKS